MLSVSILRHLAGMMRLRIVCAGIMQQLDSSNDRAGGQFRRPTKDGTATTIAQAHGDQNFSSIVPRAMAHTHFAGAGGWS
ncbi:MAG: hypothetical protein AB1744_07690, partial [Candidatus Zixiibacteriota bacterium]